MVDKSDANNGGKKEHVDNERHENIFTTIGFWLVAGSGSADSGKALK
jgi:hypothetical protein